MVSKTYLNFRELSGQRNGGRRLGLTAFLCPHRGDFLSAKLYLPSFRGNGAEAMVKGFWLLTWGKGWCFFLFAKLQYNSKEFFLPCFAKGGFV